MTLLGYLAIDQYGTHVNLKKHPRKELLTEYGRKSARKIYRDHEDGHTEHVGYIVAGLWFTIYEVHHWGKPV